MSCTEQMNLQYLTEEDVLKHNKVNRGEEDFWVMIKDEVFDVSDIIRMINCTISNLYDKQQ